MTKKRSKHVAPLSAAADRYLQVLLDKISLRRDERGAVLTVQFDDGTPAIWSRHGRLAIFEKYARQLASAAAVQREIDYIVANDDATAHFRGAKFPFRYANGGALPIIRHRGASYYCLFYREIHPIGWNIANGGSDSLYELLDPIQTLEREFHEEILVVDQRNKTRFRCEKTVSALAPTLSTAIHLASRRFPRLHDLASYQTWDCAIRWSEGPDRLVVRAGHGFEREYTGVYVNVTAADCAIEIDRAVYLDLDDDAVVIDGETLDHELLDAPVGLFEVNKLNKAFLGKAWGDRQLLPDILFHGAQKFDGRKLAQRMEDHFLPRVEPFITPGEMARFREAQRSGRALDLCPVTEGLLRRVVVPVEPRRQKKFDTFLSHHASPDPVFGFLTQTLKREVFCYRHTHETTSFMRDIDEAIEQAETLVVYGTCAADFERPWVRYEYNRFLIDKLNGRRPNLRLYTLAPGMGHDDVPGSLRAESQVISRLDLKSCLKSLARELSAT